MQMNYIGTYPGVSTITFLPIIDLPPGDETCIYSTLLFIQQQSSYLNIETPCITFDQPLWLKAVEIINAKSMNIVCRLGGFHLLMSFLGSIGKLMEGSGLTELLEIIYGSNTVKHIMTGKAYARALRAHFLTQSALETLLLHFITPMKLTDQFDINLTDNNDSHEDLNFVHETEYTGEVLN